MQPKLPSFLSRSSAKASAAGKSIFKSKAPVLVDRVEPAAKPKPAAQTAPFGAGAPGNGLAKPAARPVATTPSTGLRGAAQIQAAAAERALPGQRNVPVPMPEARFRVIPLPRLAAGGRWRTEAMRSYSAPVLLWFTRGQGRITVQGVTRGFGAHNAVFLPAGTMHGFEMSAQVFGFAVFFPQGTLLPLPGEPQHLRFRDASDHAELTQMIDNLQRELDSDLPVVDRALDYHAGLLSVWLERHILAEGEPEGREPAARRLSAAYASLVAKDFRADRTVADYAATLGVTPTHLTRACKVACGQSAHKILADRIFFEARRLLRDTKTPVNRIAAELGFRSPAYFTRAFQKVAGQTPSAFRAGA